MQMPNSFPGLICRNPWQTAEIKTVTRGGIDSLILCIARVRTQAAGNERPSHSILVRDAACCK